MMRACTKGVIAALLCAVVAVAQTRDQREASVGMRAYVEQVVLPGSELVTAPSTTSSPIVVRVLKTWPHGDSLRYDLEWVGFEPGEYDLTKYLVRKDGSSLDGLPSIEVAVTTTLAAGMVEPSELEPKAPARLDGYGTTKVVVIVLWSVGLLGILFLGRKWRRKVVVNVPKPTLADRLRPLVEEVAAGRADDARKAELERLLVAFWRARLNLGDRKAGDAIITIRKHDEAGALLRQVEAWLHMPEPPKVFDVAGLLAPYRSVTADSFKPIESAVEAS